MVSNFERILAEIRREANLVAPDHHLEPKSVVDVIMGIVDLEDQHRIRTKPRIHQEVKGLIQDVSPPKVVKEDA